MAVLLQYNLTSGFAPSTTASGVVGGTVTSASLTGFTNGNAGYSSDAVSSAYPASGATSASTAISTSSYFYVSISPIAGKQFSLTNLTIDMARGGAATPRGYDIRSSADSFATTLGTANLTAQRPTFQTITIDLSGASFQNVTGTTNITFNFYVYAPSTSNTIDWDNLTINGTISDSGTLEQEGYRWRYDDGTETTATWIAAQDTNITRQTATNTRLRILANATLLPGAQLPQLEYRVAGSSDEWQVIQEAA